MGKTENADRIVLFDGVCVFCNRAIRFLMKRNQIIRFAPLQGSTACAILKRHPQLGDKSESVVLVRDYGNENEAVSMRSEAIIDLMCSLGGVWKLASGLKLIPKFFSDWVYDFVARNRYRWFGRYEECVLPSAQEKARFLP